MYYFYRQGNNKQLRQTLKNSAGLKLKSGQIHKQLVTLMGDGYRVSVDQYKLLEPFFELCQAETDPSGTYILEAIWLVGKNKQSFRRLYVAWSGTKVDFNLIICSFY